MIERRKTYRHTPRDREGSQRRETERDIVKHRQREIERWSERQRE